MLPHQVKCQVLRPPGSSSSSSKPKSTSATAKLGSLHIVFSVLSIVFRHGRPFWISIRLATSSNPTWLFDSSAPSRFERDNSFYEPQHEQFSRFLVRPSAMIRVTKGLAGTTSRSIEAFTTGPLQCRHHHHHRLATHSGNSDDEDNRCQIRRHQ